jgi:hypothetical protein
LSLTLTVVFHLLRALLPVVFLILRVLLPPLLLAFPYALAINRICGQLLAVIILPPLLLTRRLAAYGLLGTIDGRQKGILTVGTATSCVQGISQRTQDESS